MVETEMLNVTERVEFKRDMRRHNISAEEFREYLICQKSGKTNMFDVVAVSFLTGLTKEQIITIQNNYDRLVLVNSDMWKDIMQNGKL